MASADQLKALLDSFVEREDQRFFSVAMQLAAHEARLGHGKLAEELRAAIDQAKSRRWAAGGPSSPVPIARPRGELAGLLAVSYPGNRLVQMGLAEDLKAQITRVLREQRHAGRILEHGLAPRRKLLLVGPPGTGKTMTASVLAGELGLPLFQVRLDGLITKKVGGRRGRDPARAQQLLQRIEQDASHSVIPAATNHGQILAPALLRRFDDVLHHELPGPKQIAALLRTRLGHVFGQRGRVAEARPPRDRALPRRGYPRGDEAIEEALIAERMPLREADLRATLQERQHAASRLTRKG